MDKLLSLRLPMGKKKILHSQNLSLGKVACTDMIYPLGPHGYSMMCMLGRNWNWIMITSWIIQMREVLTTLCGGWWREGPCRNTRKDPNAFRSKTSTCAANQKAIVIHLHISCSVYQTSREVSRNSTCFSAAYRGDHSPNRWQPLSKWRVLWQVLSALSKSNYT